MRVDTSVAIYADWDEATPITARVVMPTEYGRQNGHDVYVKLQMGYNAYVAFTPEQARQAAWALLTAADEAEAHKANAPTPVSTTQRAGRDGRAERDHLPRLRRLRKV